MNSRYGVYMDIDKNIHKNISIPGYSSSKGSKEGLWMKVERLLGLTPPLQGLKPLTF